MSEEEDQVRCCYYQPVAVCFLRASQGKLHASDGQP